MHIGVFDVLNKVLLQKLTGDVSKNTIFLQVFEFFALAFKTLCFLCWTFILLVLIFCVLLLFDKSSCYVLISVFVVLGFLGFFVWCVLFFLFVFWFVLFFWRV